MVDNKEALLKEAKLRYPVGCKAKNHLCDVVFIITDKFRENYNKNIACDCLNGSYTIYDTRLNKWAEIVSYPENYIPPTESILKNVIIW